MDARRNLKIVDSANAKASHLVSTLARVKTK